MKLRNSICAWLAVPMTIALGSPALAVDGVVEINHVSALAGGVTAADASGYPVTLTGPGSYRLTGGLAPAVGQSGILITGSHVTLDLNGYSIRGTAVCTGLPTPTCSTHGGDGIRHLGSGDSGIAIRNGTIQAMDNGIVLFTNGAMIERLAAVGNRIIGIQVASYSTVERSRASYNGSDGIFLGTDGQATDNQVDSNGGAGVASGMGSIVSRNRVFSNAFSGVTVIAPGLVSQNVIRTNNLSQNSVFGGIFAQSSGVNLVRVIDNVLAANGQGDLKGPALSSSGTNICTNASC